MPRVLTQQEAAGLARFFKQTYDAFKLVTAVIQPANANTTVSALMAQLNLSNSIAGSIQAFLQASFVYGWDGVFKSGYGNAAMLAHVNLGKFTINLNAPAKANGMSQVDNTRLESDEEKVLRHLRNSFAHYRYTLQPQPNNRIRVQLDDFSPAGVRTFDATCDYNDLIELAERVLIEAHNAVGAVANPPAPAAPVPPAPPALASPPVVPPGAPPAPPAAGGTTTP